MIFPLHFCSPIFEGKSIEKVENFEGTDFRVIFMIGEEKLFFYLKIVEFTVCETTWKRLRPLGFLLVASMLSSVLDRSTLERKS